MGDRSGYRNALAHAIPASAVLPPDAFTNVFGDSDRVAAALIEPCETDKTLVVVGHGNGIARTADLVQLAQGVTVLTFNEHKSPILDNVINAIIQQMDKTGIVPANICNNGTTLHVSATQHQYPDYPVRFQDHGVPSLSSKIGKPLGFYKANPFARDGQKLLPVQTACTQCYVTDIKSVADHNDCQQILFLTCRQGPSVRVEGEHGPHNECDRAFDHLRVGQTYSDMTTTDLTCLSCGQLFNPTSLHFFDCVFRIHAHIRPRPREEVPLPLAEDAEVGRWIAADARNEVEVRLPPGVVRLKLETMAKLTEKQ